MTNNFSSTFNVGQYFKFKRGRNSQKNNESKFPVHMRLYTFCLSTTMFHEILLSSFWGVALAKKKQDRQTGQKHYTLLLSWGIITVSMCLIIVVFCPKLQNVQNSLNSEDFTEHNTPMKMTPICLVS